jgi:hypothetical protein
VIFQDLSFYSHFKNGETLSGLTFACRKRFRREDFVAGFFRVADLLRFLYNPFMAHFLIHLMKGMTG